MNRKKRKGSDNDNDNDGVYDYGKFSNVLNLDDNHHPRSGPLLSTHRHTEGVSNVLNLISDDNDKDKGSIIKGHLSLDYCTRLRKKCKEDVCTNVIDCDSVPTRIVGVTTVPTPSCGVVSVEPVRGLKRKIGCIDVKTQCGRKSGNIEDDYVRVRTLGRGKFGSVWLCRSRLNGGEYACKTLKKGEECVHREVEIMQHLLGYDGVVMLNSVYEDCECFHLVMEFCEGGRLVDEMEKRKFSEQRVADLMKELMVVVKYCHEMGVVHRDIKPENVLLTGSGKLKVADFGLAMRVASGQSLSGVAGSPPYIAPEVLSGSYREKVDIWSAGILLHALLTGSLPFQGNSVETIFEAIKNTKLDFHSGKWLSVSKLARDLVEKMLTRDVSARISADEVLGHPFIVFYTERILKSLSIKSNSSNEALEPSHQSANSTLLPDSDKRLTSSCSTTVKSSLAITTNHQSSFVSTTNYRMTSDSDKQDESGLIDALVVAISQVRISGPKRSRLYFSSGSPVQQQYSTNSLCKAF